MTTKKGRGFFLALEVFTGSDWSNYASVCGDLSRNHVGAQLKYEILSRRVLNQFRGPGWPPKIAHMPAVTKKD